MMARQARAGLCVFLLAFAFGALCFAEQQPGSKSSPPQYSADTVLVKPKKGVSVARLATQHAALNARVTDTFERIGNLQIVKLPRGLSVETAIQHYRRSGLVEYAEPDYELYIALTPNDPKFLDGTLYGLNKISAPAGWDTRTSANPVIVAVIDTGVRYTHEDLAGNMWTNPGEIPGNGIDDDGNGIVDDVYGAKFVGTSVTGEPWDDHFHGSHCAGTVGAVGNNGKGVVGVAWSARIMALKFLDSSGSGATSDAIKCINYAIAKGAKIMSNSWGGGGAENALRDAIIAARDADALFVAAAGNSAANVDATPFYPAAYDVDNIVSVAATDSNDSLASFSNYGLSTVDLGAPGVSIWSCDNSSDAGYRYASGTSMATPHVAGAAALVRAQFPALSYSPIVARLLATTDPVTGLAGKTVSGGRLNVQKALTQDPVADFSAVPGSGEPPLTVTFTDTSLGTINSRALDFGDGNTTSTTTTTHRYDSVGTYNATLSVTGPGGTSSKTRSIVVAENYTGSADTFGWVETSGLSALSLTDDSYSTQFLPFTFSFYGQNYTSVFVGSNGLLGFGSSANMSGYTNTDLPNGAAPNNIICAYWDDLNPGVAGQMRVGTIGSLPERVFVASWEGVPHYASSAARFSFQALLFEGSNEIKIQWLEVQPANLSLGAGRSATVGVENSSGTVARRYTYNGSPVLLGNNQAIRFSYGAAVPPPPPPPPPPPLAAPSGLTASVAGSASARKVVLSWIDNSVGEEGTSIERSAQASNGNWGDFIVVGTAGANVTTFEDATVARKTRYRYRLRTFAAGQYSPYSATVELRVP